MSEVQRRRRRRRSRRLLVMMLISLAVLSGVLLVRTALVTSRQMTVDSASPISVDAKTAASRLGQALQFRTISYQDRSSPNREAFIGLHQYLA